MEKKKKSYLSKAVFGLLIVAFTVCCIIAAPITEAKGTLWSLFPPVIAIGLALITKEVYSSLFVGILSGGIIYAAASGTGFEGTFKAVVQDGLITNLSNAYNVGILVFLVVLGIIVVLMNKAGGSRAYGEWAAAHIKGRRGAALSTFFLGVLIFVDDYFQLSDGRLGNEADNRQAQHITFKARLSYRFDSRTNLHYRTYLIVGGGGKRYGRGRKRNITVYKHYPV